MISSRLTLRRPLLVSAEWPWVLPLATALVFRLWQLDLTRFNQEHAVLLETARAFAASGEIPLTSGLAFTIGVHHPPLIVFILALPSLFTNQPVWVAGFQATLDACATLFLYLLGRDIAGRWAGLSAALVYAVLPPAVLFSRLVWNPDLVPFFSAVALWGAVGFAKFGDSRRLASAFFAVIAATQLHPSSSVFLAPLAFLTGTHRRELRWRPLAIALAATAVVIAPYVALQLSNNWEDLRKAAAYVAAPKHFAPETLNVGLSMLAGGFARQSTGPYRDLDWKFLAEPAAWLMLGLTTLGVVFALRRRTGWIAIAWLALPIIAALRASEPVFAYYVLGLLPAGAALAGLGAAAIRPRVVAATLLTALVLVRVADFARFESDFAAMDLGPQFGMPLRYSLEVSRLGLTESKNGRLFVGQAGAFLDIFDGALFRFLTEHRLVVTRFDARNTLVMRPEGGLYAIYPDGHAAEALVSSCGEPSETVVTPAQRPVFRMFQATSDCVKRYLSSLSLHTLNADIGHVLHVQGYAHSALSAGMPSSIMMLSQVTATAPDRWPELHQYGHLVDAQGRHWSSNPDFDSFPTADWRAGDLVLTWFDVNPPPDTPLGGYWLETGFYPPDSSDLPHVFDGNTDLGSTLRIGPLRVAARAEPAPDSDLARLGKQIVLAGVSVDGPNVRLTWRALEHQRDRLTVFVHGLDSNGRIVAQHDGLPMDGTYPTDLWETGDIVHDQHVLHGDWSSAVQLAIGLYGRPTLQRISVSDVLGNPIGDQVLIPLR